MPSKKLDEELENELKKGDKLILSSLRPEHRYKFLVIISILISLIIMIFLFMYPDLVRLLVTTLVSAAIGGGAGAYIGTILSQKRI